MSRSRWYCAVVVGKCTSLVTVNAISGFDARRFQCLVCVPYCRGSVMRLERTLFGALDAAATAAAVRAEAEAVLASGYILNVSSQ